LADACKLLLECFIHAMKFCADFSKAGGVRCHGPILATQTRLASYLLNYF